MQMYDAISFYEISVPDMTGYNNECHGHGIF